MTSSSAPGDARARLLERLTDLEKRPGARRYTDAEYNLDAFDRWLKQAGIATDAIPWIHIAGTKGKGSTAALCEALLRAEGLTTGLFTSPHMDHYGERFRFDGEDWTYEEFLQALARIEPLVDEKRTVFEVLTAIALREFPAAGCDAGILEVGLGGRLDCTNVIREPLVTVITSIGLDHTAILGNSVEKIAAEKAGIIKPAVPVVVFEPDTDQSRRAFDVIVRIAEERGAPLHGPVAVSQTSQPGAAAPQAVDHGEPGESSAGGSASQKSLQDNSGRCGAAAPGCEGQKIRVQFPGGPRDLFLPLAGSFQRKNLGLALRAVELALASLNRAPQPDAAERAMTLVRWGGRIERLSFRPPVILDAAHCPLSARALGRSLREGAADALPAVLLWGMQKDKDAAAFLAGLLEELGAENITSAVCYEVGAPRGAAAEFLVQTAAAAGVSAEAVPNLAEAFTLARSLAAERGGGVVACGTVYTLGRLRALGADEG